MPQFMISPYALKIEIATLVAQSSGIPLSSSILWQSSISTLIPTSPLDRIISSQTSDSPGVFPIIKYLKASIISSLITLSIGPSTVSASAT